LVTLAVVSALARVGFEALSLLKEKIPPAATKTTTENIITFFLEILKRIYLPPCFYKTKSP
jgi:hypothetical protein